jgi:pyrroloquinoline quinone biosynthesis protein D
MADEKPFHFSADLIERPVLAAKTRVQRDKVTQEMILLYPEGFLQLNATAAAIIALCDGQRTLRQIVEELAVQYHASPADLQDDVTALVCDLSAHSLLDFHT